MIDSIVQRASAEGQGASGGHAFHYDRVFDPGASQEDVFSELVPLLRSALKGRNVCIFAVSVGEGTGTPVDHFGA
jgi:hypothetical protein